ncbi:flagellar biosynthesis regulator FlaF [Falsiroseomonas sp. CW058]|uniref:flagellar biosynthesis regulator FlaF n=1 Tax=Falsiroseomonas sp. CW058 TaxID=3388664 RepID=UPI003D3173F7
MLIEASPSAAPPAQARAVRAYGAVQSARSQRAQEAEVFSILAGRLHGALKSGDPIAKVRAAADARRVFTAIEALVIHPSCPLPMDLRMSIGAVSRRALREVEGREPDLGFLAGIAEDFALGLADRPQGAAP